MILEEIREVAIHEVSHLYEPSHSGRFHKINLDHRTGTWRPPNGLGISVVNNNIKNQNINKKNKKKVKPKFKINEDGMAIGSCGYCFPRGNTKSKNLTKCDYCEDWFCEMHKNPRRRMSAPFNSSDINKQIEWNKVGGHPCSEYSELNPLKTKTKYIKIYSSKPKFKQREYEFFEDKKKGKYIWILIIIFIIIILYYLAVIFF